MCNTELQLHNINENVSALNIFFYYKGLHFNEIWETTVSKSVDTAYSEWIKTTNSVSETCNSLGHWEYRVKWVGVKDEHPLYLANCVQFLLGDQILRKLLCFLWMWGTHVNICCVFFSQENLPKYANILGLILNISPDYLQVFLRKYISNCRKNNLL